MKMINIPQLTRAASFEPASLNADSRTVELIWTTGARVLRARLFDDPFYEELLVDPSAIDLSRFAAGAPLLVSHENHPDAVVGIVERAWLEGGVGKAAVRFGTDEESDKYFQKVRSGILKNVSVGYSVQTFRDVTTQNDRYQVLQAVAWTPMEISLVGVGADAGAGIRADSGKTNPCTIEERDMKKRNQDPTPAQQEGQKPEGAGAVAEVNPEAKPEQAVEVAPAAEPAAADPAPAAAAPSEPAPAEGGVEAARREGALEEGKRRDEIGRAVRVSGLGEEFARQLIEGKKSVEEARAEIINELEKRAVKINPNASIQAGSQDEVKTRREGAVEALLHRIDSKRNAVTEKGKPFYGMSLVRMAEEFVGRGSAIEIAQRAMSTADIPLILADVANKRLMAEYQVAPKLFLDFVSEGTLPDFKEASRVQLNDMSDLALVGEDGEFKSGVVSEGGEKIKLGHYGTKILFTYKAIINDDLSALSRLPKLAANAAVRLENKLVFDVLTGSHKMADGQNLFHANHANLGTAAALSETEVDKLIQLVMKQKTSAKGDFMALLPNLIIAGPQNQLLVKKLTAQGVVPGTANDVSTLAGYKSIIAPWISGKEYFVACTPDQAEGIEVAYLDGQKEPMLTSEKDFDTSGLKMKVEHHFGVKALDYRPFAKNPGA